MNKLFDDLRYGALSYTFIICALVAVFDEPSIAFVIFILTYTVLTVTQIFAIIMVVVAYPTWNLLNLYLFSKQVPEQYTETMIEFIALSNFINEHRDNNG